MCSRAKSAKGPNAFYFRIFACYSCFFAEEIPSSIWGYEERSPVHDDPAFYVNGTWFEGTTRAGSLAVGAAAGVLAAYIVIARQRLFQARS